MRVIADSTVLISGSQSPRAHPQHQPFRPRARRAGDRLYNPAMIPTVPIPWPNGPTSLSPGQRLGRCPRLRNDAPLARLEWNTARSSPTQPWPNGPTSLSPGQRPGLGTPIGWRPVGPRFGATWSDAQRYRTPLGRGGLCGGPDPGRCPGLRNDAPLAQTKPQRIQSCHNPCHAS